MQRKPTKTYHYRGPIERGATYAWRDGYSTNAPTADTFYPWMTRRECKSEAKAEGCQALFFRDGKCETVSKMEMAFRRAER
jgi:hypothetical protein